MLSKNDLRISDAAAEAAFASKTYIQGYDGYPIDPTVSVVFYDRVEDTYFEKEDAFSYVKRLGAKPINYDYAGHKIPFIPEDLYTLNDQVFYSDEALGYLLANGVDLFSEVA